MTRRCTAAYAVCGRRSRKYRVERPGFWWGWHFGLCHRAPGRPLQSVRHRSRRRRVRKYFPSGSQEVLFHFFLPRLGFVFCQEEVKLLFPAWDRSAVAQRVGLRRRERRSTASLISTYTCFPAARISEIATTGNERCLAKSTSRQQLLFCGWEEAENARTQPCPTLQVLRSQGFLQTTGNEVTASARNPGQPQMKDTREGQARVNPGAGGRLQSAQANRAIPWIPRGTRRTGGYLGLEAAQWRTPGVRLSPGHPEGLDQGVASHPPLRGCLSGRCHRRRRSCIH